MIRNPPRSAFGIRGFKSDRYGIVRNYDADGYADGRSGHHVGEGWFVAGGADLPGAGAQPRIHELDLLATVHALLGQAMRPGMRGRPVAAMLPLMAGRWLGPAGPGRLAGSSPSPSTPPS